MSALEKKNYKRSLVQRLKWLAAPMPLSWHLGALVGAVAIPAVFLGAILLTEQHKAELASIERDAMARAEALSYASDAAVIRIISTLQAIGSQPDLARANLSGFSEQVRRSFAKTGITVTLRNNELVSLKSTDETGASAELTGDDAEWARSAVQSGVPTVSNYSIDSKSAVPVVHVLVSVEPNGRPQLLLDAMVPAASFNATLLQSQLPDGWSAGLSDRNDRIIARTHDYERFSGQLISESTRRNTKASSGIIRSDDLLGRPTLQAYLHSDLTGWRLSTWAPRSLIEARARESWRNFAMMAAALVALSALSAWIWAGRLSSAVAELAESARHLERDLHLPDAQTPVLEVNRLRDSISSAAAELIRRKDALVENEERLRQALDAGGMGVWEWDQKTDATQWDAAVFRLTGFKADGAAASGRAFIDRIAPDDRPHVEAGIAEVENKGARLSVDFRFRRPDNVTRWLAVRGGMFKDRNALRPRFMGVMYDITSEKDSAARTRALLLEISHRSKNLLAVILAIGRLTARDAQSVRAYERSLTLRVGALAASQDLIVASDWQGVDLEALILSQLSVVASDKLTRARVMGPGMMLNPAAAQNLGMAIAELGLNANDHGALSNGSGTVTVSWELSPAGMQDQIYLTWIERDGPAVAPARKRGYGLAVVERLVAQSLKAKAEMRLDLEGVRWSLTAPLSAMGMEHSESPGSSPEAKVAEMGSSEMGDPVSRD